MSKQCRNPGRNEKVNETDDIERPSGGGRGYCRQLDPGAGGGGGGAGGARGSGAGGAGGAGGFGVQGTTGSSPLLGMFDERYKTLWDTLTPILQGQNTSFSPTVMAAMDANAKLASRGEARAGRDAVLQDSIRRGMGRSPNRALAQVERGAVQSFTQATNQNRITKAVTDFQDRMRALETAEKQLGQMQQYVLTLDQTQAGREKAIQEIALGYARIAAEKDMLSKRLASDQSIASLDAATRLEIARLLNLGNVLSGLP